MRLVVWNCRQALNNKFERLLTLQPDLAVVPECAGPEAQSSRAVVATPGLTSAPWHGTRSKHKGLGVFTFGKYRATATGPGPAAADYSLHVNVTGPMHLELVAIWSQAQGYVENVHAALDAHRDALRSGRAVLAGDFNSSANFDRRHKPNHSDLVNRLKDEFGMVSAYHAFSGERQGAETQPTHRHPTRGTLFHIDYAFVPQSWAERLRVEVGQVETWTRYSDHFPLIVDIANEAPVG